MHASDTHHQAANTPGVYDPIVGKGGLHKVPDTLNLDLRLNNDACMKYAYVHTFAHYQYTTIRQRASVCRPLHLMRHFTMKTIT